jgi:hypothetical protein
MKRLLAAIPCAQRETELRYTLIFFRSSGSTRRRFAIGEVTTTLIRAAG